MRPPKAPYPYATVPRAWPGETCVILASGPSLCAADVDQCQGRRVIAIKDAVRLAPWCDVLYGSGSDDSRWWAKNGDAVTRAGRWQYSLDPSAAKWTQVLRWENTPGLATAPNSLRGNNSLAHALGLAVHLGVSRVVILGADMGHSAHSPKYFFGDRDIKRKSPFGQFMMCLQQLVEPLRARGVTVVNASRATELTCFPREQLAEALL